MPSKHYFKWLIKFRDSEAPRCQYNLGDGDVGDHYLIDALTWIYSQINNKRQSNPTQIPLDQILFTLEEKDVDVYRFTCYFEATRGNGFGRFFFSPNQTNLSAGAQAFIDRKFIIEKVEYGEKAEAMFKATADHVRSNDATIKYFEKIASRNSA